MTAVAARFAGGSLTVETDDYAGARMVVFEQPGANRTPLWPDEARRLAVALIEQAAQAEQPEAGDWP
ncbi:hypothetical protein [Microbacterium sp. KR10-403]|uniref:hypothetical protein n=1 Tax=Microbacterium sp. KR10-403 TaxID=3158581 RepID=UPI0032E491ED